jgi:hypothetical protein
MVLTEAAEQPAPGANPASPVRIQIDATAPRVPVSPELYGIFFKEINHAGAGGQDAELVQNGDFEANAVEPGWRVESNAVFAPTGSRTNTWFTNDLPGWSFIAEGAAEGAMQRDTENPLDAGNPHSLRLNVTNLGARCGVANSGYWGMNIQAGEWYDASFHARTKGLAGGRGVGLVFSLESTNGQRVCARVTLPEVSGGWRKYTVSLLAYASEPRCRLVISPIEPCTIWFDVVSLCPRKTFKNRPNGMRPDPPQMLADLRPGFLGFPAGTLKVTTLGHADATAENTLENPNLIMPVESELAVPGAEFSAVLTPNSLTVLRLPAQAQ